MRTVRKNIQDSGTIGRLFEKFKLTIERSGEFMDLWDHEQQRFFNLMMAERVFSARTIQGFSTKALEYGYGSFFINAAINEGTDTHYIVDIPEGKKPKRLLILNGKDVTVNGTVSDFFCEKMSGGEVTVNGNIEGSVLANGMTDGRITVIGDLVYHDEFEQNGPEHEFSLLEMHGGEIRVMGAIRNYPVEKIASDIKGGKVYVRDDLVIDR